MDRAVCVHDQFKWTRPVTKSVSSALRSVHFVDVDIVDRGFGYGRVEPGEQLFEGFILAPAEHGNRLASL